MTESNATDGGGTSSRGRSLAAEGVDLLWYVVILTLWTVGLALLFLAMGWPRWAFYTTLLVGVVLFATLHAGRSQPDRTTSLD